VQVQQQRQKPAGYWEKRKDSVYLFVARQICQKYCPSPQSVLDVGWNKTPTLEWHRESAKRLVSVDLRRPYSAPGVESLTCDFLKYEPEQRFDLVTCFQVLEHVPDPAAFAAKLLQVGNVVVVSVPYKWKAGKNPHHIHDPVDEAKMLSWFGREPDFAYLARELNNVERLIHVYRNGERRPKTRPFRTVVPEFDPKSTPPAVLNYPSMMSTHELSVLYWLARSYYRGDGIIVDAGLFLGASTNAFALGLRENPVFRAGSRKPIHSYDRAIFSRFMRKHMGGEKVKRLIGDWEPQDGEDYAARLRGFLAPHSDLVEFHFGELSKTASASEPVEIAFYDCLKQVDGEHAAFTRFTPQYIPGRTIVIQQDYFYDGGPEHRIRQERHAEHFELIDQFRGMAVFRVLSVPPVTGEGALDGLTIDRQLALLEQAAARCNDPVYRLLTRMSCGVLLARYVSPRDGLRYLDRIKSELGDELEQILARSKYAASAWSKHRRAWSR